MVMSAIVKQVVERHSCVLVRVNPDQVKGQPIEYSVKPYDGNKQKWTLLDAVTANAMLTVYDALSESNKAAFDKLTLKTLVDFTWKHVH